MKKTKLTRSLLAACSIVALSAVVYGCAHTDDGPSQDELDAANAAATEAAAAAAAAEALAAEAEEDAAAVAAAAAAAEAEAAAAAAAAEAEAAAAAAAQAAAEAQAAEDAAAAQAAADAEAAAEAEREAAQMEADRLQMEADAAQAAADKANAVELYLSLFQDLDPDDDVAVFTASDGDIHDTTGDTNVTEPGIVVTATRGEPTKVSVILDDPFEAAEDNTIMLSPAFATAEEGMADEIEGWSGTLLERTAGTIEDTMTVYTNIDATSGVPFGEQHMTVAGSLLLHDNHTDLSLGDATPPTGAPDLNIAADAFTNANFIAHANNAHDNDGDGVADYVSHMGTYQGAMGVYQCRTGADTGGCTSRINDNGAIVLGGTETIWTFTPDPGAEAMVADSVYLYFGWWLREYTAFNPTDHVAEMVFGSTGGSSLYTLDADVTGAATFEGNAAGKYALRDRALDTAEAGHWTADATLTASFGSVAAAGTPDTGIGTISGEISNFSVGEDWKVALRSTPMYINGTPPDWDGLHFNTANIDPVPTDGTDSAHGTFAARQHAGTEWTMGDRSEGTGGNWSGTFYQGNAPRSDGTPHGAAGEFSASFAFDVGVMVGAFGVINTTPDTTP